MTYDFICLPSERPKTYRPGRICKKRGCRKPLTIYNPNSYCFSHSGEQARQLIKTIEKKHTRIKTLSWKMSRAKKRGESIKEYKEEIKKLRGQIGCLENK